jgi:hypothetical protein
VSKTTLQLEALQQALTNKGESSAQRGRHEQAVRYQERLRSLQGEIKELRKRGKEYSTLERLNRERCVSATLRNARTQHKLRPMAFHMAPFSPFPFSHVAPASFSD